MEDFLIFNVFFYIILLYYFAYCHELQVNKADRTEVDVVTYCDELQVNKGDGTEVNVVTYCDELQVDKANRTEVDVVSLYTCSWNCNIFVNGSLLTMSLWKKYSQILIQLVQAA